MQSFHWQMTARTKVRVRAKPKRKRMPMRGGSWYDAVEKAVLLRS